ncbi:uncharacterized protein LOC143909659 isoform X2 [Arctopsyche grandis]
MARILFTELIWQKKTLIGESKPFKIVNHFYEEYKDFCISLSARKPSVKKVTKPRYIRVNTLKLNTTDAIQNFRNEGWNFVRCTSGSYDDYLRQLENLGEYDFITDYHVKVVFAFPSKTSFFNHEAYINSEIFLQDKATCLAGHLLAPTPGSTILDMCAAPGMKTTHLAQLIKNDGVIYSVEQDQKRFDVLSQFVEASGATCVKLINKDVTLLRRTDCPNVDYILLDPSCSGSGIDRGEPNDFERDRISGRLERLSNFQAKLLRFALNEFYTAKRVVYSTCSLYPKENEEVIRDVLKNHKGKFRLVSAKEKLNNNWNNTGDTQYVDIGEYCIYAKPDTDYTSGFFIAVFERFDDGHIDDYSSKTGEFVAESDAAWIDYNQDYKSESNLKIENIASDNFKNEKKSKNSNFNSNYQNNFEKQMVVEKTAIVEHEYSDSRNLDEEKEILITKKKKIKNVANVVAIDSHVNNIEYDNGEQNDIDTADIEKITKKKKNKKVLNEIAEDFSENGIEKIISSKVNNDYNIQNVGRDVEVLKKKKKKSDCPDTTITLNCNDVNFANKPVKNKNKKTKDNVNSDIENHFISKKLKNVANVSTVSDPNVDEADVVIITKAKRKSHCKDHDDDGTNLGKEVVIKKKKKINHNRNHSLCVNLDDSSEFNKSKVVDDDLNDNNISKKKRKKISIDNVNVITENSANADAISSRSALSNEKLKKKKRHISICSDISGSEIITPVIISLDCNDENNKSLPINGNRMKKHKKTIDVLKDDIQLCETFDLTLDNRNLISVVNEKGSDIYDIQDETERNPNNTGILSREAKIFEKIKNNGIKSKKKREKKSAFSDIHNLDLSVDLGLDESNQFEIEPNHNKKHRKSVKSTKEESTELCDLTVIKDTKGNIINSTKSVKLPINEDAKVELCDLTIDKSERAKKKKSDKNIENQKDSDCIAIDEKIVSPVIDSLKLNKKRKRTTYEKIIELDLTNDGVCDLTLDNSLVNNHTKKKKKKSSRD